jgi:hypothetical protein
MIEPGSEYLKGISSALQATAVVSPTRFTWFGQMSPPIRGHLLKTLSAQRQRSFLLDLLQSKLYTHYYCLGVAQPSDTSHVAVSAADRASFLQQLSDANCGLGSIDSGWELLSKQNEKLIVRKGDLSVLADADDVLDDSTIGTATAKFVSIRSPKEALAALPNYYVALGNHHLIDQDSGTLCRFYFNSRSEGAVLIMREVTRLLADIPYQLKALSDPREYTRCDAVVLYVRQCDYSKARNRIANFYPTVAQFLKNRTPALTKRLAPGLGFAEDPGGTESFGQSRSRLLAEIIVGAHERKLRSLEERLSFAEIAFSDAGLRLQAPFLNTGSHQPYRWSFLSWSSGEATNVYEPPLSRSAALDVATKIALHICETAIWHEGRCNWLGSESAPGHGASRTALSALDGTLYRGSAGISIFLANTYRATGEECLRRTALGAINHSLARVNSFPKKSMIGLFTGGLGIALAAACAGLLLEREDLTAEAACLANDSVQVNSPEADADLLAGNAGGVIALLILKEVLGLDSMLSLAEGLTNAVVRSAEWCGSGCSWKSSITPISSGVNLTGMSHGTSGISSALIEIHKLTRDPTYLSVAEGAIEYERRWLDREYGDWPRFNVGATEDEKTSAQFGYINHWCHGAPGIAANRLRIWKLLKKAARKAEAIRALNSTHKGTNTWLESGCANFSLCHGLAGNAEVLRYGGAILDSTAHVALADQVSRYGATLFGGDQYWPCGTGAGHHPGLMIGTSGIGYHYLRLSDPTIPSMLILEPEAFGERYTSTSQHVL